MPLVGRQRNQAGRKEEEEAARAVPSQTPQSLGACGGHRGRHGWRDRLGMAEGLSTMAAPRGTETHPKIRA